MFTAHIRSFLGGNKEKLCNNLAKNWSVKQIANTFFKVIRKSLYASSVKTGRAIVVEDA